MLRYEIKLGNDDIKKEEMIWREKYLSPSLSYISGVTNADYHIEKFPSLQASNTIINSDTALSLECYNVIRQGYIIVKEKEYDTFSGETTDYSIIKSGETIDYRYVINKDKYFYWGELEGEIDEETSEAKSGYTFNNLLNYNEEESAITEDIKVEASKDETPLKIDTLFWIEDGEVEIDGHKYIYDKYEGENGILKYGETGVALEPSAITRCSDIEFYPYSSSTMYEEVTKFALYREELQEEDFDRLTFARYYYYVKYKNHYCPIKQNVSGDDFSFVCEIPYYILSATTVLDNLETKEYPLYFMEEYEEEGVRAHYAEVVNDDNLDGDAKDYLLNSNNLNKHFVYNLTDLKNVNSFIYINDFEKAYFTVEHDVLNANDGNEIIAYLDNRYLPVDVGEKLLFINNKENNHESIVYNSKNYGVDVDENYVIFNGKKYLVIKNLRDKVVINENEYDIEYDVVSGKTKGIDCLVIVGEEKVPMNIVDIDGGEFSGGTLQRYGRIISGSSKSAITATYDIKPYDGIIINGEKYIIYEIETEEDVYTYAAIDLPKKYTFIINSKIGNSTYVCEPDVNQTEFTDEFNKTICNEICNEIVNNQPFYSLYVKNKIFGEKEIEKDLPFIKRQKPVSSDDYYDLFNDLVIYIKNGYIHIPISLKMDVANNTLQDDIVTHDFYEAEKKKAINPIVDMEKDVYVPKFIYGYYKDGKIGDINQIYRYSGSDKREYRGSSTIFKKIYQINLNFHFRTRTLESWKVNDGDYLVDTSGDCDNWFVTDFHPYSDIINDPNLRKASGDTLQRASDLMGLLYFTNDDVFYQRSKIAKSFARLSVYDNIDPQTQSLLSMSCAFMDEQAMYKKYIDNSRKYELVFGSTSDPREEYFKIRKYYKITVDSEFLEYLDLSKPEVKYDDYDEHAENANVGAEEHRMSSRIIIDNKYKTKSSSEGFYLYVFREYQENLRPKPMYMKIEFNHAGIGKTIPFLIPMHWEKKKDEKTNEESPSNKMIPTSAWTFSDMSDDDLKEFKEGFPLSYVYAQTYIPIYAVYDFDNREYCYVFDERYVDLDYDNGILNLNLFEMKIKDESHIKPTEEELEDIKTNKQEKAIINVNTKQFDKKAFNYEVE
jgi:hypothetical protein